MANIQKALTTLAAFLAVLAGASGLMAQDLKGLGLPEEPHGYPAWFSDSNGLQLELCLAGPLCLADPVDPDSPFSVITGFGGEAFWLLAGAEAAMPGPVDGRDAVAELTLALEAAYGGDESIVDGNQVSFGRVRVRMDVATPGTYRVTHPYGQIVFPDVPVGRRAVNHTSDIGGANPLDPASAFAATLLSDVMNPGADIVTPAPTSFITWPNYGTNPALLVDGKQYIGDPNVDSTIVGSPTGNNFFRVERQTGTDTWTEVGFTNLFSLMGREFDGRNIVVKTTYGVPPTQNLAAVGPVNRQTPFSPAGAPFVAGFGSFDASYPIGYPLWYADASGLRLTITFPPMGISEPLVPPENFPLNTAGETFYWAASASFDAVPAAAALDPLVEYAIEGTFGGDESILDGNQITFARLRIRIDTPVAGTYTVTHPYGTNTFEVDPALLADGINYTQDIGNANPIDPDTAFNGTLFGIVGPNFLTWEPLAK
jgi:hypothetical protein